MKKLGIGVIGLGMASKPHFASIELLNDQLELKKVYARSDKTRNEFSNKYQTISANNINEIVTDDEIDIVLILTPPNVRLDIIKECVVNKKAILVEKPLGRNAKDAKEINDLCKANDIKLGVVLQHRYRTDVKKLKNLLGFHVLGDIYSVRLNFPWWREQSYYDEKGRGTYERDGGGVLISQCIHILDLMLYFLGPVTKIKSFTTTSKAHRMEAEDFVVAGMEFANGAIGSLMATTAAYPGHAEELIIEGDKATARLHKNILSINYRDGTNESFGTDRNTGAGADPMAFGPELHCELLKDFVNSINENQPVNVTGDDAVAVQELIDQIIAASK